MYQEYEICIATSQNATPAFNPKCHPIGVGVSLRCGDEFKLFAANGLALFADYARIAAIAFAVKYNDSERAMYSVLTKGAKQHFNLVMSNGGLKDNGSEYFGAEFLPALQAVWKQERIKFLAPRRAVLGSDEYCVQEAAKAALVTARSNIDSLNDLRKVLRDNFIIQFEECLNYRQ